MDDAVGGSVGFPTAEGKKIRIWQINDVGEKWIGVSARADQWLHKWK